MKKITAVFLACILLLPALLGCAPEAEENTPPVSENESEETVISENEKAEPVPDEIKEKYSDFLLCFFQCVHDLTFPLTEKEKAGYFNFLISQEDYSAEALKWRNEETQRYEIPLADIERILFASLDVYSFNPAEGFPAYREETGMGYDTEKQLYIKESLGGFGGATAVEIDNIEETENGMIITVAVFDFEKYYKTPQEKVITSYYVTEWEKTDDENFRLSDCRIKLADSEEYEDFFNMLGIICGFFYSPVEDVKELKNNPQTFLFLIHQVYWDSKKSGEEYERDENQYLLIPEEDIRAEGQKLLGIDFDFSCIEEHEEMPFKKVTGKKLYRFTNETDIGCDIGGSIIENSLRIEGNEISVLVKIGQYGDYFGGPYKYTFEIQKNGEYRLKKIEEAE